MALTVSPSLIYCISVSDQCKLSIINSNHSFPQPFFSARLVSIVLEPLHGIKAINGIKAFISVNTTPPLNFIPSTSLPIPPLTSFPSNHHANQTPLFLLSNMANLMTVKLDQSNYIVWKDHITSLLKTYPLIQHLDESIPIPDQFLCGSNGEITSRINSEFESWQICDQALVTLINSTLSPAVVSVVMGVESAIDV